MRMHLCILFCQFFEGFTYNTLGDSMASIEEFKSFVRKNPGLLKQIKTGEMTWQKYYEIFDLYGENSEIWKPYLENVSPKNLASSNIVNDIFSYLKNIDLNSVQEGIGNIQKVLGALKNTESKEETPYKPRPIYKHFED